jgi:hypothetical protein
MSETSPRNADDPDCVADDKLRGASAIGREIAEPVSRVYYLFSQGRLAGAYKDGRDLIASKAVLRQNHRDRALGGK